jgi:4-aminobutyrate aminotransferase
VRGIGLMQAIELVKNRETREPAKEIRDRVINLAVANGLLLLPCGVSGIRFVPAITVTREELDVALGVLDKCLAKC